MLTSGVLFLGSVFIVGRLGERLVAGTGAATAAIFGVATLAAPLAPTFFEHDAAGAFAIAGFAFAWLGAAPWAIALAGLCAGTAVLFQYATGLIALALLVYASGGTGGGRSGFWAGPCRPRSRSEPTTGRRSARRSTSRTATSRTRTRRHSITASSASACRRSAG